MTGYCTLVLYFHSPAACENTDAHSCNIQPYCLLSHQIIYIHICVVTILACQKLYTFGITHYPISSQKHMYSVYVCNLPSIPDRLCNSTLDRLCNSTPDRLCNSTPDRLCNSTPDRLCNSTPDRLCNSTPDRLCNSTPDRLQQMKMSDN